MTTEERLRSLLEAANDPAFVARFWEKVAKGDGCWEWTGARDPLGYGRVHTAGRGESAKANRIAWIIANGEIPAGLWVLHRCDNPRCVRPDHLYLGTHADNMADRRERGPHYRTLKEMCPRGHPYSVYGRWHGFSRHCRECQRQRWHERKARVAA